MILDMRLWFFIYNVQHTDAHTHNTEVYTHIHTLTHTHLHTYNKCLGLYEQKPEGILDNRSISTGTPVIRTNAIKPHLTPIKKQDNKHKMESFMVSSMSRNYNTPNIITVWALPEIES